jgi:hypothetical protein
VCCEAPAYLSCRHQRGCARHACPPGGFKKSGIGREVGPESIDPYTEIRGINLADRARDYTVDGEVLDAYDSGFGKQVVVSVTLAGSDEPVTATFHAEAVELAA